MVDIASFLPVTTLGGAIGLLINVLVVFIAIAISEKIIAHSLDVKRILIIALVALFVVPIAVSFAGVTGILGAYIIPLVVWIILGELLLKAAGWMPKLKVMIVAFVVYIVLGLIGLPSIISGFIPF